MVEGVTTSGFKFSGDEKVMDNMELIDALADLDSGNTLAMSKVCKLVLGDDTRKELYDHLRTDDGRVPPKEVEKELLEIINFYQEGKKSSTSPT
ncbi:MAG: hypothetical protein LUD72_07685 [Bacteroidales bacterium]|nr:hypothetical protein [Bacteroidales bacterium]